MSDKDYQNWTESLITMLTDAEKAVDAVLKDMAYTGKRSMVQRFSCNLATSKACCKVMLGYAKGLVTDQNHQQRGQHIDVHNGRTPMHVPCLGCMQTRMCHTFFF